MPSDKKRINLTVPDEVYDQLQAYKEKNGITNDASACLQLIVQQLKGLENMELVMKFVRNCSMEQLEQMSKEGLTYAKDELVKTLP